MPRKTRRQKERSLRRSQGPLGTTPNDSVKREFEFSFSPGEIHQTQKISSKKSDLSVPVATPRLMTRDLIKTLAVAIGIIGLELVLYFAKFK